HDVAGFLERELLDRCEVGYPPFTRLGLVRIDAADEDLARSTAARIARDVKASPEVRSKRVVVLGPAAAPIARLRGRYRFRVLLRAEERGPLRAALAVAARARDEADRRARVVIDVDPVAML
ncbi:MAG: primosomal protein N', partial [Polyangiaceae bacterium]|nr:primosomal protein N' [Polyangiaceae bacterium]